MKIAYILATFPCSSETFVLREIVALEKAGTRVIIFALRASEPGDSEEAKSLARDTIYRPAPLSAGLLKSNLFFLRRSPGRYMQLLLGTVLRNLFSPVMLLKSLRNFPVAVHFAKIAGEMGADHVHAHFAFVPADLAAVMAALLDRRYSVSAHAWDLHTQNRRMLRARLAGASFVAACTGRGHERLADLLPDARIVTVRHGLDITRFAPASPGAPTVLAVGRLVEKKGFADLIRACRILADRRCEFSCIIAGDGPLRRQLADMTADLKLGDRVRLVGSVGGDALLTLYRDASIFALPSVALPSRDVDGLPNAILEAMAMQIPVISTDASSADEAIKDGVNGFIVPAGSPEALAEKIELLLKDGTLRAHLGSNGRKTVAARFDGNNNIKQLIALFSECP